MRTRERLNKIEAEVNCEHACAPFEHESKRKKNIHIYISCFQGEVLRLPLSVKKNRVSLLVYLSLYIIVVSFSYCFSFPYPTLYDSKNFDVLITLN